MRLNDAYVERFGTWRDLSLPADSGIAVFYGPNETGKTTLMKFLRGMLYGFHADVLPNSGGSLGILHNGQELRLERRTQERGVEHVAVKGWNRIGPPRESLQELLHNVSAEIYSNVFAIGLTELQELATLNGDAVADAIYGVSLAPEGRKLLNAIHSADQRRHILFDTENQNGQLAELLDLDRELAAEIESLKGQRDEYEHLCARQRTFAADVAEMKARKNGMLSQLRGHRFLDHVWGPWKQVREYHQALAQLPDASRFPRNGLERLAKWNDQIASETRCRNVLKEELQQLKIRIQNKPADKPILEFAERVRAIVAERPRIERALAEQQNRAETFQQLSDQQTETLATLGPDWTAEQLDAVDASAEAQFQLLDSARTYQVATVQRGRFRRLYKRLSGTYARQLAKGKQRAAQLGGKTPEAALADAKRMLADNENRLQLDRREAEFANQVEMIRKHLSLVEPKEVMPSWFFRVLIFFAIAGGLVCAAGLYSGLTFNAIAGGILGLVGLTGIIVAWGLNTQSRGSSRVETDRLKAELREAEFHLDETRRAKQQFADDDDEANNAAAIPTTEQLAQRIADLKAAASRSRRQEKRRRRLVDLRGRLPRRQQAVTEARQKWCEALTHAGLPENVKVDESFDLWQKVCQAADTQRQLRDAKEKLKAATRDLDDYRSRIDALGRELDKKSPGDTEWLATLDAWQSRLDTATKARDERRKLVREIRVRRNEAARYAKQIFRMKQKRQSLFTTVGAANEDEFERLAGSIKKRSELAELLELAEEELREAAAAEPELAVVEEDLVAFDAAQNSECIHMLELEIGEIESDLQAAHEELGRVKQSIEVLAKDRRLVKLKYEQARVHESIQRTMEEWLGVQLAQRGLDAVRTQYERSCQPAVLAAASEYFERLTGGQYRNLWAPLGRRVLCVDDEQGQTREIDQLSGGTREQLFLAVRLATIDHFRERGVELPMVLDDVLVNFDEIRTDSAIATLMESARRGQQILFFTCHRHLADRFAGQGSNVINLPDLATSREDRLAG